MAESRPTAKADKRGKAPKPVRAFLLFVAGALAITDAVFGPHIQAWYKTMPHAQAVEIGLSIMAGIAILVGAVAWFLAARSSNA